MPFFFLLVDSWLELAGGAGVPVLAGCEEFASPELDVAAGEVESVVAGVESVAGEVSVVAPAAG